MIGHCLGAAGGLEAIATIKSITTGWVHPTINQFVSNHYPEVHISTPNFFPSLNYNPQLQNRLKINPQLLKPARIQPSPPS